MLPWLLCALLGVLVLALLGKVRTLTRSLEEICDQMEDRLEGDTNNLLTLSTRDPHARRLAARLNAQLRLLRQQRRQYLNGDRELKEAPPSPPSAAIWTCWTGRRTLPPWPGTWTRSKTGWRL